MTAYLFNLMIFASVAGQTATPQLLPKTPGDWRFERIEFPLPFAPDLKYQGFEELGFAPGMFNAKSDTYFTYVFAVAISDDVTIDAAFLKTFLEVYYRGLCKAVAEGTDFDIDPKKIVADVREDHYEAQSARHFTVTLQSYDPFVTGKPLTLHLEVITHSAPSTGKTGARLSREDAAYASQNPTPQVVTSVEHRLFAVVSPKSYDAPLWKILRTLKREYRSADTKTRESAAP